MLVVFLNLALSRQPWREPGLGPWVQIHQCENTALWWWGLQMLCVTNGRLQITQSKNYYILEF